MIADQNFNDKMFYNYLSYGFGYGLRPKFFMAEHSATAEGENRAYGPTLLIYPYSLPFSNFAPN